MRSKAGWLAPGTLFIFVLVCGNAELSAQNQTQCSNETLTGAYGFSFHGFLNNPEPDVPHPGGFVPVAVLGTFTFDGVGAVFDEHLVNFGSDLDGLIHIAQDGPYEVNPDCSGSVSFPSKHATFLLRIVKGGDEVKFMIVGGGRITEGTMTKQ